MSITFSPIQDFLREPVDKYEGRLMDRRHWRGKRMSVRRPTPTDRMGALLADCWHEVARELTRRGEW